mmetsp:Transcript_68520/g.182310  ORF Transcript_68520/g.182310 Transcript_68520/m.182310 type:complete len:311 (-) Transcript_68520:17-949(-)
MRCAGAREGGGGGEGLQSHEATNPRSKGPDARVSPSRVLGIQPTSPLSGPSRPAPPSPPNPGPCLRARRRARLLAWRTDGRAPQQRGGAGQERRGAAGGWLVDVEGDAREPELRGRHLAHLLLQLRALALLPQHLALEQQRVDRRRCEVAPLRFGDRLELRRGDGGGRGGRERPRHVRSLATLVAHPLELLLLDHLLEPMAHSLAQHEGHQETGRSGRRTVEATGRRRWRPRHLALEEQRVQGGTAARHLARLRRHLPLEEQRVERTQSAFDGHVGGVLVPHACVREAALHENDSTRRNGRARTGATVPR